MIYGLTIRELCIYGLGFSNWERHWLDRPPEDFLQAIADHTLVSMERIKQTTLDSIRPYLAAFLDHRFFSEGSVMTSEPKTLLKFGGRWLLRAERVSEITGCRLCLERYPNAAALLPWRLRLITCCPSHGIMLERIRIDYDFAECFDDSALEVPIAVRSLDAMTWKALTEGCLELPSGPVHAGVWFRILRSIAEELIRPIDCSEADADPQQLLVWDAVDRFLENANTSHNWQQLAGGKQAISIAIAIDLMLKGTIIPKGINGKYFCAKIHH